MAFGWQGFAVSLALGSVGALVLYVVRRIQEQRNMNRNHEANSFRERQEHVIDQRNIVCPFCNKCVQKNDHQMSCGHRCHKSCYQKRLIRNRNCTYCQDTNGEATTSSTQSRRRSSILNECCYCNLPIQSAEKPSQLNCKHLAHKTCYDSFNSFMQCQTCNFKKYRKSQ